MSPTSIELIQLRIAEEVGRFGSFSLETDTGRYHWTTGMYRLLELDPELPPSFEVYMSLVPEEDRERVEAEAKESLGSGRPYMREYRLQVGPSKREMWVRAKAAPYDNEGRPSVVGVILDVTEQVRARLDLQELNRALLAANERQQDAIEMLDAARLFQPGQGRAHTSSAIHSSRCPKCSMVTWNAHDVTEGYCGNCHDWTMLPRGPGNAPGPRGEDEHERDRTRGQLPA